MSKRIVTDHNAIGRSIIEIQDGGAASAISLSFG